MTPEQSEATVRFVYRYSTGYVNGVHEWSYFDPDWWADRPALTPESVPAPGALLAFPGQPKVYGDRVGAPRTATLRVVDLIWSNDPTGAWTLTVLVEQPEEPRPGRWPVEPVFEMFERQPNGAPAPRWAGRPHIFPEG
jgi:hypothetical protein